MRAYLGFEGIEACGKTTVLSRLREEYPDFVYVREPGGTPMAEKLRTIAISVPEDGETMHRDTEALLFMASRIQLLSNVVVPALNRGATVVSDRTFYSSLAYQGAATRGEYNSDISELVNRFIRPIVQPDFIIHLDVDVETSIRRKYGRGELDAIESRDREFFEAARNHFLRHCRTLPNKHIRVDATQSPEAVYDAVVAILKDKGVIPA